MIAWLFLLLAAASVAGPFAWIVASRRASGMGRSVRVSAAAVFVMVAAVMLRPHEDVFTGLDTSCYRNMAHAIATGVPLRGSDELLRSVPWKNRRAFLLEFHHAGRDTRDRSFEITDLETCGTRPYFQPALPLAAAALERCATGAGDYLVPLAGVAVFATLLLLGLRAGGGWGIPAVLALWLGSPVPAWIFRGHYAEALAAAPVILVLAGWLDGNRQRGFFMTAACALGLSLSFHISMAVLALPTLALLIWDASPRGGKRVVETLLAFSVGLLPLVWMTATICAPYGNWLDPRELFLRARNDGPIRLALAGASVSALALFTGGSLRMRMPDTVERWMARLDRPVGRVVLFLLCLVPAAGVLAISAPALNWANRGAREWAGSVRLFFGIFLLVSALAAGHGGMGTRRTRVLLALTFLMLPFFWYLKGFETAGLWAQRRLLPLQLLFALALVVPASAAPGWLLARVRTGKARTAGALFLAMGAAAFANMARWPAPYVVRYEHGATAWVQGQMPRVADRTVLFDYFGRSVPFAIQAGTHVVGLNEQAESALPGVMEWLRTVAATGGVVVVTAYSNPGMEEGFRFEPEGRTDTDFPIVRSKAALPAVRDARRVRLEWLRALPVSDGSNDRPALDKKMDGGPLALRGPWGAWRSDHSGVAARWSRQNSGVVGPVPRPGESVRIRITARSGQASGQTLWITPPWTKEPASRVEITQERSCVEITVSRATAAAGALGGTGVYRFSSPTPYNPALEGHRNYDGDLGALIERVQMEIVPGG